MLGKVLYRYRQRFGHGFRTAWFRDVVRPRILASEPISADDVSVCEIHVLTSSQDWMNLLWALKSFYIMSRRKYALCIHDDGSLSQRNCALLQRHFPAARILDRRGSEAEVLASLTKYPRCREFRLTNPLAPKVFDFRHYLRTERMLLLDSDVLFFQEPVELLRRIEDPAYRLNTVNGDVASAYTVEPVTVLDCCGVRLLERFNSGLGLIHRNSLQLDWIEEFLSLPGIIGHFWRIEQTLFALCSSRFGAELLPREYDVFLDRPRFDEPARHYVGAIRHQMYSEGIRVLNSLSSFR